MKHVLFTYLSVLFCTLAAIIQMYIIKFIFNPSQIALIVQYCFFFIVSIIVASNYLMKYITGNNKFMLATINNIIVASTIFGLGYLTTEYSLIEHLIPTLVIFILLEIGSFIGSKSITD